MTSVQKVDERAHAIEQLYRRRYVEFRNGLATLTGGYESARDVVQEAFARALRRRQTYRGEGSLEAWVWKIAVRVALEHGRRPETTLLNGSLDPMVVEPERDPELAEALRSLPPRRRLIVFLRYFADLSYGEIAAICGVSEGTVGAALTQARAALGQALVEAGDR
jgi:RNA polymerase sigma-70 factor (ECF subfamily)